MLRWGLCFIQTTIRNQGSDHKALQTDYAAGKHTHTHTHNAAQPHLPWATFLHKLLLRSAVRWCGVCSDMHGGVWPMAVVGAWSWAWPSSVWLTTSMPGVKCSGFAYTKVLETHSHHQYPSEPLGVCSSLTMHRPINCSRKGKKRIMQPWKLSWGTKIKVKIKINKHSLFCKDIFNNLSEGRGRKHWCIRTFGFPSSSFTHSLLCQLNLISQLNFGDTPAAPPAALGSRLTLPPSTCSSQSYGAELTGKLTSTFLLPYK